MNSPELWRKILAAPSDEPLKAQYVQALKDEGNPRGEMFEVSASYHAFKSGSYFGKAEALKPRLDELLKPWETDFRAAGAFWGGKVTLIKAWPIELEISAAHFIRHAADIVKSMPLRHLTLKEVSKAPGVFEVPEFKQITTLDACGQPWSLEATAILANSSELGSLRWLNLAGCKITEEQVEILAASQTLRCVRMMDLRNNECRDPVDNACGCGYDWQSGGVVPESIYLPPYGHELEERHGKIPWLHALDYFMKTFPIDRHEF